MSDKIIFIVAGKLGKSLIVSKVSPFCNSSYIKKAYVFAREPGYPIKNCEYICLPKLISYIKPKFLNKLIRIIYEPLQLFYYTIKLKPDYINGIHIIPKGINAALVSKLTGVKSIISVIGNIIEIETRFRFKFFWKNFNLWILKISTYVTTTGSRVSNYLIENNISQNKIYTYPGSIDTSKFRYDKNLIKTIDLIFAGTFRELKGPDRALEVIKELKTNFPNIKATFIGNGVLFNTIAKEIKSNQLQGNVELLGYINDPSLLYKKSKIIIMPSKSEGMPMAMVEAMACGAIPVVSEVGNIADIINHSINGFLVKNYNDIHSFRHHINFLLENNSQREKISLNASKSANDIFSVEAQKKIIEKIISTN